MSSSRRPCFPRIESADSARTRGGCGRELCGSRECRTSIRQGTRVSSNISTICWMIMIQQRFSLFEKIHEENSQIMSYWIMLGKSRQNTLRLFLMVLVQNRIWDSAVTESCTNGVCNYDFTILLVSWLNVAIFHKFSESNGIEISWFFCINRSPMICPWSAHDLPRVSVKMMEDGNTSILFWNFEKM